MTNSKTPNSSIQVIDRSVLLLDALSEYEHPVSLKFLSADTGLHPSTAFRILASLIIHRLVEKTEHGDYRLGTRLLNWGDRVRSRMDLRAEARLDMDWLRDEVGETVNLTVRDGDEVLYVERAIGRQAIRVEQVIGSRAPLHVTAVGKLMLGELGKQACEQYVQRTGLPVFTANTLNSLEKLQTEIHQAMQQQFALDNEEAELGVGCIGALIRNSDGSVAGGLSISAPIERRSEQWADLLLQAAQRISARMGFST